jgi:streptomycin 6-kinase
MWHVDIDRVRETETSLIAFGRRRNDRVVLKVGKLQGDEWQAGQVAAAFAGHGVVRVYETSPGAALMEELTPGTPLVDVVNAGDDDKASRILAGVIQRMLECTPSTVGRVTADDWGKGFARYLASGDSTIPAALVSDAQQRYGRLCASQKDVRLLHGDLQHYNVLYDDARGWLAIDPKGVVAEVEYELGAALRNPHGRADLLTTSAVTGRIAVFADALQVDRARVAAWAYVQGVLSAVWTVEDGFVLKPDDPAMLLVMVARPLLK